MRVIRCRLLLALLDCGLDCVNCFHHVAQLSHLVVGGAVIVRRVFRPMRRIRIVVVTLVRQRIRSRHYLRLLRHLFDLLHVCGLQVCELSECLLDLRGPTFQEQAFVIGEGCAYELPDFGLVKREYRLLLQRGESLLQLCNLFCLLAQLALVLGVAHGHPLK